ncbi:MAG: ABC transporter transmembrane domain-containing protein [Actinomycetota bacterium]
MVFLSVVALLVASSAELGVGIAVRNVVDGDLGASGTNALLLTFFGVAVIFALATYCRVSLVSWLGERVAADARKRLFSHLLRLSPSFYDRNKTAEILSRLVADTAVLQTLMVSVAPAGLHSLVLLIGSAALMAVSSAKLAAAVLAAVPVLVLPAVFLGRRVRRRSRESQDELAEVNASATESLESITTVQAFNHEDIDSRRLSQQVERAFQVARRRFRAEALLSTATVVLIFGLIAGVLWLGANDLRTGNLTAGGLTAFLIYALIAASSFAALMNFWSQVQRAAGAAERIMVLLRAAPEVVVPKEPAVLPDPGSGRIIFENVTFHYPSRPNTPALENFTLEVASGETVALVGPSGAGKSTVFSLLLRFYDPQEGRIMLDGVDLTAADPRAVRARIGVVSQEPAIFNSTVAENIRYGCPDATDDQVHRAAKAAAATEFVDALPQGFDTPLGERGLRLSVGQRQRLAIARALVEESGTVLLLDEATSALDSVSEKAVQQAVETAATQRTCLIIAHRLATARMADRIVVMDRGRLVAAGTHEQLIEENGLYAQLARLQLDAPFQQGTTPQDRSESRWSHVPVPSWPLGPEPLEEEISGQSGLGLPQWNRDVQEFRVRRRPD